MEEEEGAGKDDSLSATTLRQLEDRNVRYFYADIAWQGITGAGIGTYIAVFLVRLGASPFLVGLLSSLPALVVILLSVPAASLIEGRRDMVRTVNVARLGARSFFLLVALVPFVLTGNLATLAPAVIVGLWSLSAVFSSAANPGFMTVIGETVSPRRRPLVNGGRWALHALVVAVFVSIFGWMLDVLPFPDNYQVVFLLSFLAGVVSLYTFSRIRIPDTGQETTKRRTFNPLQHIASLPRTFADHPDFARFLFGTFVYRLGLNLPAALFPVFWVTELQSSDTWIGYRTTAGYVALMVAYFMWGRIASRRGHYRVLLACSLGLSAYPILTALVRSPEWLIPAALVWGFFSAGIDISFFEGLLETCPREVRTTFAAINAAFANLAAFAGPMLGAAIAGGIGLRSAFVFAGALDLVGALLLYILVINHRRVRIPVLRPRIR